MSAQVPYYGPFSNEPCQTVTEWVEITYEGASLIFHKIFTFTGNSITLWKENNSVTRRGFGFRIIGTYEF